MNNQETSLPLALSVATFLMQGKAASSVVLRLEIQVEDGLEECAAATPTRPSSPPHGPNLTNTSDRLLW